MKKAISNEAICAIIRDLEEGAAMKLSELESCGVKNIRSLLRDALKVIKQLRAQHGGE